MNRAEFKAQLQSLDLTSTGGQSTVRERMLLLLEEPRCFHRDCFPAHFTGSALIANADRERVLLNHHRNLNLWMQFGGHCDGEEDPLSVAMREAREESGIEEFALPFSLPIDLDIHPIPARGPQPAHEHYDVRYLLVAPHDATFKVSEESHALAWFTHEAALRLPLDESVLRLIEKWDHWRRHSWTRIKSPW